MRRKMILALTTIMGMSMAMNVCAAPSPQRGENTTQAAIAGHEADSTEEYRDVIIRNTDFADYDEAVRDMLNYFNEYVYENGSVNVWDSFSNMQKMLENGEWGVIDTFHFNLDEVHLFKTGYTVSGKEDGDLLLGEEKEELLQSLNYLTGMMEVVFINVEPTQEDPVTVTITDSNLTSLSKEDVDIYMLYFCPMEGHNGWELLKADRPEAVEGEEPRTDQINVEFHAGNSIAAIVYVRPDKPELLDMMASKIKTGEEEADRKNLVNAARSELEGIIKYEEVEQETEEEKNDR